MNKRRIVSILLSALLLMGLITPVGAASTPKVTLSGSEVAEDGTITLTASIEGNPGMSACQLYFYYDTDVFEAEELYSTGTFARLGGMLTNSIAIADDRGVYDGKAGQDGMLALWYNNRGSNTSADGEFAVLVLKLKEDAKPGNYDIGLGYSRTNTINESGDHIALTTRGVTYTVVGEETTVPESGSTAGGGTQKPSETLKPGFAEMEEEKPIFDDVAGNWAEDYILEAAERGIVKGDKGHYYPNDNMTRAEFMMILWRVMGSPTPSKAASFTDLTQAWYLEPIAWAEENGITNGTSPTTFDPQGNVTREQMMTILYRLAGSPTGMEIMWTSAYDSMLQDSASISSWAKNAVYWSIYNDILCGEQSVKLGSSAVPGAAATRSQIAVSIIRYLDN